ncbi:MAG: hypothetical protein V1783_00170 [Bacteroidota bacterium]|jgi:hypothetical protein
MTNFLSPTRNILLLFIVLIALKTNGQHPNRWVRIDNTVFSFDDIFISASSGTALKFGSKDNPFVNPSVQNFSSYNNSYAFTIGKWVLPYLALRANLINGQFHSLFNEYEINSRYREYGGNIMLNITGLINQSSGKLHAFYPYVFMGYGLIDFESSLYNHYTDELTEFGKTKMVSEWVVPLGIGIAFDAPKNISFSMELTHYYINTDRFDATIDNSKDSMLMLSVGASITFNRNLTKRNAERSLRWMRL